MHFVLDPRAMANDLIPTRSQTAFALAGSACTLTSLLAAGLLLAIWTPDTPRSGWSHHMRRSTRSQSEISAGPLLIPVTNAIEALNAKLRHPVKIRGHFPTDEAATKLTYHVLRQTAGEWKMPPRDWSQAKTQFAIMFEDRFLG